MTTMDENLFKQAITDCKVNKYISVFKQVVERYEFLRINAPKTPEQIEDEIWEELKESAHYFGGRPDGFKRLREMVDEIEDAENEAAWERHCNDH